MAATGKGVPYPAPTSGNDVPADLQALAEWVDARPGVSALTTAQRDALAGAALWNGRVVLNLSTRALERYDTASTSWRPVGTTIAVGPSAPGSPQLNDLWVQT